MSALERIRSCLEQLEFEVNKVLIERNQEINKVSEVLEEIEVDIQENISRTIDSLNSTAKGLGFTITLIDLLSERQFAFESQISICYRNLKFTGNEKHLVSNQQINQKFVLPILKGKQVVEVQIWELGEQKKVFTSFQINLRDIIGMEESGNCFRLCCVSKSDCDVRLNYSIQVRGFGFQSWKKQDEDGQVDVQSSQSQQVQVQVQEHEAPPNVRAEQQKRGLNRIYEERKAVLAESRLQSFENNISGVDDIMSILSQI